MSKKVILCVDDEELVLASIKAQLKNGFGREFSVETSLSAEEALEFIDDITRNQEELMLIISDHIMPGMKGDEFLIRIYQRFPQTYSIMLTGHAESVAIQRAVNEAKLYKYLSKPWDQAELISTVSEAIKNYFSKKNENA
jgi:CheY-like chemotaxis protein